MVLTGLVSVRGELQLFVELLDGRDGGFSEGVRVSSSDPVTFLANITSVFPEGLPDTCIGFRFFTKFASYAVTQDGVSVPLSIPDVNVERGPMYRIGVRVNEYYIRAMASLTEDNGHVMSFCDQLVRLEHDKSGMWLVQSRGRTPTTFRYDFVSPEDTVVIDATGKPVTEIATPPTVPPSVLDGNVLRLQMTKSGPVVTLLDHDLTLDGSRVAQVDVVFDEDMREEAEGYQRRLSEALSGWCTSHYSEHRSSTEECRYCGRRFRDMAGRVTRTDVRVISPGKFRLSPGARFAIPVGDSDSVEIFWNGYALRLPEPTTTSSW